MSNMNFSESNIFATQNAENSALHSLNVSSKDAMTIDRLVRQGEKIKAIGKYREVTGLGLAEAKEAIEKYAQEIGVESVKSTQQPKSGGCYIATCVYGSYDCPQVWTLRRYRDNALAETWYGRTFIKTYYAISPSLVKCFGNTNWFKKVWRRILDHMVNDLQHKGFAKTPYKDKENI